MAALTLVPLLSACAGSADVSTSTVFGPNSDRAIVLLGTSVSRVQVDGVGVSRSLETYWQEYDPDQQRLVRGGKTFLTSLGGSPFSEAGYTRPTISVLEIDPGDYALIGAGFPHLMTIYVRTKGDLNRSDSGGNYQSWTFTVDPRRHIDPEADVDPRANVLFSVRPGQILYIGHFRFEKRQYSDSLDSIDYSQDEAAAREALKDFPGIAGTMVTLDLRNPAQSVSR